MAKALTRGATLLVVLVALALAAFGGLTILRNSDFVSPFGISSEGQDTQVIQAVTRTQEVSLLSLAVEGINEERQSNRDVLGLGIPGTGRTAFVRYSSSAKLGLDGEAVSVTKTGANAYRIGIPEFVVIGYDKPKFEVAVEDDGILSWVTPDIDTLDMVNEVFNDAAQQKHLATHRDQLKEQAELFYTSLITSIDPEAVTTFEIRG